MLTVLILTLCGLSGVLPEAEPGPGAAFPDRVVPHPRLGKFEAVRDPDNPILGFYGGIGLQVDDQGKVSHYGIHSKAAVDKLIQRCVDSGMDRIYANIMFQWTESELLNPIPVRPVPDDPNSLFSYAIDQAHRNNIEIYLDIPVFGRRARDETFVLRHPEVFTKSYSGAVKQEYFSPASPVVRAYRIAVILEALSHYPVDGIQLDFIRWPGGGPDLAGSYSQWGYEEAMLNSFRMQYELQDNYIPEPDDPRFIRARAEMVTLFIKELRYALAANGIDLPIGVYNSNSAGRRASERHVCQDWAWWEELGLVNEHHPMFYLVPKSRLTRAIATLIEIKQPKTTVYGPIFLDGPGPKTHEQLLDISQRMIKVGCDGIWFCLATQIEQNDLWPTVKQIGELSISEVRARSFDPYYENLVANGDFSSGTESWISITPDESFTDDARSGRLILRQRTDEQVGYRQIVRHIGHPVFAPRSLYFSFDAQAVGIHDGKRVCVTLTFVYSDGQTSSREYVVDSVTEYTQILDTTCDTFDVDYNLEQCLTSTTIEVVVPQGDGKLILDNIVLLYDPLHEPRPTISDGESR